MSYVLIVRIISERQNSVIIISNNKGNVVANV